MKLTYHRNDRGRELFRISHEDELVTTMDEWSESLNLTRLPGLENKVHNEKVFLITFAVSLSVCTLSNSQKF